MTDSFVLALAQVNPTVGDIAGNIALIKAARALAPRERMTGLKNTTRYQKF